MTVATLPPSRYQRNLVPDGCPLTVCEFKAIRLMADGLTYKEAALKLGRSVSTLRTHLFTAYQRLGVPGATQAVVACVKAGWLDWTPPEKVEKVDQRQHVVVTPAHKVYLYAFDLVLRTTGAEREAAEQVMDRARRDAGIPLSQSRQHRPRFDPDPRE